MMLAGMKKYIWIRKGMETFHVYLPMGFQWIKGTRRNLTTTDNSLKGCLYVETPNVQEKIEW